MARALPIPPAPPVTKATLPDKSNMLDIVQLPQCVLFSRFMLPSHPIFASFRPIGVLFYFAENVFISNRTISLVYLD
jgi:hypothetical protein